jgi:hypothetical protein
MRVLAQIINGDTTATAADVTPLINHSDLIMRRLALKALGKIGDPASVTVLEQALADPENAIRTAAVYALIDKNRPESAAAILNAVSQHGNQALMEGAVFALRNMAGTSPLLLQTIQSNPNEDARAIAMRAIAQGGSAVTSTMRPAITAAMNDSSAYVRAFAVDALARIGADAAAVDTLIGAMASDDPILATRATQGLSSMLRVFQPAAVSRRTEILAKMEMLFREYGDGNTRTDDSWGYVPAGNALYDIFPDGRTRLRTMMNQRTDRKMSERAWEILHLHQRPGQFVSVTEADDAYAHFKRPRWDTVIAAKDSFAGRANGTTIHNQQAQVGQKWLVTQGNAADQVLQSTINNGDMALKAVRRLAGSHEIRLAGDGWDGVTAEISRVTAKADWLRTSATDFTAFGIDAGPGFEAQITIDPNSFYRVWQSDGTAEGGQYLQTGVLAGVGGWETIEIVVTWNEAVGTTLTGSYDVYLTRDAASSLGPLSRMLIADDVAMHSVAERTIQQLMISNQPNGLTDVTTYWDNVSLTVGVVPEPTTVAPLALLGLALGRASRRPRRAESAAPER